MGANDILRQTLAVVEARDPNAPCMEMPDLDSLRSDPRFESLLRRMNLPL